MLSKKMEEALNAQVNTEIWSDTAFRVRKKKLSAG